MAKSKTKLTVKEALFVKHYVANKGNGTQAAKDAGYSGDDNVAGNAAHRLLRKAKIQDAVSRATKPRLKRLDVSQERVLQELARLGFSDFRRFGKWHGESFSLHDSDDLHPNDTAAVQSVTVSSSKDGGSLSFKLHDKMAALKVLAKFTGIEAEKEDDDPDEARDEGRGETRSSLMGKLLGDAPEPGEGDESEGGG